MEVPTVAEDAVEYWVYVVGGGEGRAEVVRSDLCTAVATTVASTGHIWQRDGFALEVVQGATAPHLHGRTAFGDNVDDEWFIVHFLHAFTLANPDVVVRVADNDGEFLLIEAAMSLPEWVAPETCEGRAFLYNGTLHIVPPDAADGLPQLLAAVVDDATPTAAPPAAQAAIASRTGPFPDAARDAIHVARCALPPNVAYLLQADPQLVAPAATAFYTRDVLDVAAAAKMEAFPPSGCVEVMVNFTRCLYAQLVRQRYEAPPAFAALRPPGGASQSFNAWELGMKLASGFEILMAKGAAAGAAPPTDNPDTPAWRHYRRKLVDMGYFAGVTPGTPAYDARLHRAQAYLASTSEHSEAGPSRVAAHVAALLERQGACTVEAAPPSAKDGDLGWMDAATDRIDAVLKQREAELAEGGVDAAAASAGDVVSGMEGFVGKESDFTGVEADGGADGSDSSVDSDDVEPAGSALRGTLDIGDLMKVLKGEVGLTVVAAAPPAGVPSDAESDMMSSGGETSDDDDGGLLPVMAHLDAELAGTTVPGSFAEATGEDGHVHVEYNLVNNWVHSVGGQAGQAGPATTILGDLGVDVPPDWHVDAVSAPADAPPEPATSPE